MRTRIALLPPVPLARLERVLGTDQGTTGGCEAILAMGTDLSIGERRGGQPTTCPTIMWRRSCQEVATGGVGRGCSRRPRLTGLRRGGEPTMTRIIVDSRQGCQRSTTPR